MDSQVKTRQTLTVTASCMLVQDVYSLVLEYPAGGFPPAVRPGQFVGVYTGDSAMLLPRPVSICEWDGAAGRLRLVYRVAGKGTGCLARLRQGDQVEVLGLLGNGYDMKTLSGRRVLLLGGGIGIPPLLGLAQALWGTEGSSVTAVLGFRTKELFLTEEFAAAGQLRIATDDGTIGYHGNAVGAARTLMEEDTAACFDVICACGPLPMLRGVKELARELGIPAFVSLEERMACGVGACLGCVTRTTHTDAHSRVCNARVCTEGPVFPAEDVAL